MPNKATTDWVPLGNHFLRLPREPVATINSELAYLADPRPLELLKQRLAEQWAHWAAGVPDDWIVFSICAQECSLTPDQMRIYRDAWQIPLYGDDARWEDDGGTTP